MVAAHAEKLVSARVDLSSEHLQSQRARELMTGVGMSISCAVEQPANAHRCTEHG